MNNEERNENLIKDDLMDKWYMKKINDREFWFLKTINGTYCRLEPCKECFDKGVASCAEHSPSV